MILNWTNLKTLWFGKQFKTSLNILFKRKCHVIIDILLLTILPEIHMTQCSYIGKRRSLCSIETLNAALVEQH